MIKILEIYNLSVSAEQFVGDRFSYFQRNGDYEMHLIATPNDSVFDFAKKQGIKYFPVEIERQVAIWKDIKAFFRILRYICKEKFDIVVVSNAKATLLGATAAALAGVPCRINHVHGSLSDTMKGLKKWLIVREGRFVGSLSHINICVSPSVLEKCNPAKSYLIGHGTPSGVDTISQFNPENLDSNETSALRDKLNLNLNDFVIGFCGRLVRDKGIEELVGAFELLKQRHPDRSIKLMVIGMREIWDSISKETERYIESSNDIVFTGAVPHSEIHKYYGLMNVFVLPSYREGWPTVVLEASSMALPVVVSRARGCIDSIVEGETGLFVDITPSSIASAIERFFDKAYAENIGRNGRARMIRDYEHTLVNKNWLEFFNALPLKNR